MTKRVESTTSAPEAARPRFTIDSILQNPVPHCHWVPVSPQTLVQLQQPQQQKPPLQLAALQQGRADSQYLIQFLLNAGLPRPPCRPVMTLGTPQQLQQQQIVTVSPPPASSAPGLCGPVPMSFPSPSIIQQFPQQLQQQQQETLACSSTTPDPEVKFLPALKERRKKRGPPELLSMEPKAADPSSSPRSRQDSTGSAEISNDSEDGGVERGEGRRGVAANSPTLRLPSPLLSSSPSPTSTILSAQDPTHHPHPHHPHHHHHRDLPFKKSRTSFTKTQIQKLEEKFGQQKYLTKMDRTKLAAIIGLTEKHVKTWFQNRRTKWKKECSDADWSHHKEMAATLMYNQYLETKSKSSQGSDQDEKADAAEIS